LPQRWSWQPPGSFFLPAAGYVAGSLLFAGLVIRAVVRENRVAPASDEAVLSAQPPPLFAASESV
jgi:hypothetical protein